MTFEDFQSLSRDDRARFAMNQLAAVAATQDAISTDGISEVANSETEDGPGEAAFGALLSQIRAGGMLSSIAVRSRVEHKDSSEDSSEEVEIPDFLRRQAD